MLLTFQDPNLFSRHYEILVPLLAVIVSASEILVLHTFCKCFQNQSTFAFSRCNSQNLWINSSMVTYFCHHLADNYVDMLDLYVDLSVIYVDFSDHYVYLSEKYHQNQQLDILYMYLYCVNATNCHLLVSLISDKSNLLSDKST